MPPLKVKSRWSLIFLLRLSQWLLPCWSSWTSGVSLCHILWRNVLIYGPFSRSIPLRPIFVGLIKFTLGFIPISHIHCLHIISFPSCHLWSVPEVELIVTESCLAVNWCRWLEISIEIWHLWAYHLWLFCNSRHFVWSLLVPWRLFIYRTKLIIFLLLIRWVIDLLQIKLELVLVFQYVFWSLILYNWLLLYGCLILLRMPVMERLLP